MIGVKAIKIILPFASSWLCAVAARGEIGREGCEISSLASGIVALAVFII